MLLCVFLDVICLLNLYFSLSYSCHLLLGEVENAQQYFTNCLEAGAGVCLDRRIIIDAADGQSKAQVLL